MQMRYTENGRWRYKDVPIGSLWRQADSDSRVVGQPTNSNPSASWVSVGNSVLLVLSSANSSNTFRALVDGRVYLFGTGALHWLERLDTDRDTDNDTDGKDEQP